MDPNQNMNLTNSNNDPSTGLLPRRGAARRGADQAQVLGHLQRVPLPRHKVRLWLNLALTIQLFIATSTTSGRSQGFEEKNLGSSLGLFGQ